MAFSNSTPLHAMFHWALLPQPDSAIRKLSLYHLTVLKSWAFFFSLAVRRTSTPAYLIVFGSFQIPQFSAGRQDWLRSAGTFQDLLSEILRFRSLKSDSAASASSWWAVACPQAPPTLRQRKISAGLNKPATANYLQGQFLRARCSSVWLYFIHV